MEANTQRIQRHLKAFTIRKLFVEELFWNVLRESPLAIIVDNYTYILSPLVEKSGVKVYLCDPDAQGNIPADRILRKIEREITKSAYEHILVYVDAAKEQQVWQWVKRQTGKASASRYSRLYKGQSGERLSQKLAELIFQIEEMPVTTEVTERLAKAFDTEPVTQKFFKRFQKELKDFIGFIDGIMAQGDKEWYASLMLNRLMFIYFIQRQGFLNTRSEDELNGERDYLRIRLERVQAQYGRDEFHTFYRYFLLNLFSNLNTQEDRRTPSQELDSLLGRVPYLNGGLFDVHKLEHENPDIRIPDVAFKRIFDFFDEFDWHLDDRPLHKDTEINPDVLGYIFEQYINQKQMGAYYTKEDITEYISKNTIIPYLFEATKQDCEIAFVPDGAVWSLLRDNPDDYIYEAVAKGTNRPLPPQIEAGVHDISQRTEWNKPAPEEYALPTETWREVVARRQRYEEVHSKLVNGEITSINDLITYNLNMCKFAEDVITYCEGTDLLNAFYKHIRKVTVLDPTCGSGAFLFAALNILKPLYEACLTRMQTKVDERTQLDASINPKQRRIYPDIRTFQDILHDVAAHHNRDYFILKSIIINNLYGVDIMEEATEICKLRLFLKLVAQVGRVKDIEPLPDIDFNIRAGNTLIGFTNLEEIRATVNKDIGSMLTSTDTLARIEQKAQEIERGFQDFRNLQTRLKLEQWDITEFKQILRSKLEQLNTELDICLAAEYKIDRNNKQAQAYEQEFKEWQQSHQPFHWYAQFYGIMRDGGFDVIVGNPPYVEYSKVRKEYTIKGYKTESCGNLYAFVLERSLSLLNQIGKQGLIVPISIVCTQRMSHLQRIIMSSSSYSWHSNYAERPSKLFAGAEVLLTISLLSKGFDGEGNHWMTGLRKWSTKERSTLFDITTYEKAPQHIRSYIMPKISSNLESSLIEKVWQSSTTLGQLFRGKTQHKIFYRIGGGRYWKVFTTFQPRFVLNGKESVSSRENYLYFDTLEARNIAVALLSSTLFYWYFVLTTNGRDLNPSDLKEFPFSFSNMNTECRKKLVTYSNSLMEDYRLHKVEKKKVSGQTGNILYEEFYPRESKSIIDEIDRVLAKHYGFTDEELDFIINYDIKYRMGRNNDEGSEA